MTTAATTGPVGDRPDTTAATGRSTTTAAELVARIDEAVATVRERSELLPKAGIVLGTGLGGLAREIAVECAIDYTELPHFPVSTVESHEGRLLLGTLDGVPVVAMQGRFHRYEGYTLQQVTFPIRVMAALGADTLLVSGACGGMDPLWPAGQLVVLEDHINLLGDNPLVGPNADSLGPRFPDMSEPYDRGLRQVALDAALAQGIPLAQAVYVAVTGPCLETRAEYRMLRGLGADVVGMSTVPEVIVARHMGMRVCGLSIVTDVCLPDALEEVDVPTIIRVAMEAEPGLTAVARAVIASLA